MWLRHYLDTRLRLRLASLRHALRSDRGESPVPTAIIIVGLALLAVGVLAMASDAIDSWELLIPPASAP
jgi:hypothetical protein